LNSFHTYNCLHCSSKRLNSRLKHERYSKHITAHLLLGVRSCGVHILLVRSLPVGRSTGPQVHRSALYHSPEYYCFWSV